MSLGVNVADLPLMLDPGAIAVEVIPEGFSKRVATVCVMVDKSTETEAADVALLVGAKPENMDELVAMIIYAADHGVKMVVVDRVNAADLPYLRTEALRIGMAVFRRDERVSWLAIADLLRDLFHTAEPDDMVEASGVGIGDLPSLADALSSMLGGPVIIEDAKFQLLSYSTSTTHIDRWRDLAILGRKIPDSWLEHLESVGALETLLNTDEVITVEHGPFQATRRLLCSIRAERFFLGVLWVAEGDVSLPSDVEQRMAAAARVAAPHLLRHQEVSYGQRAGQRRLLRGLLESGKIPTYAAEELGISRAQSFTLMALRGVGDAALSNLDRNRVIESVSMYYESYRWSAATCALGNTIYCLLAHDADVPDQRFVDLGASVLDLVQKSLLGRRMNVAVSERASRLNGIPMIREQVDQILDVSSSWHTSTGPRITRYADAYPRIVLTQIIEKMKMDGVVHPKLELLRIEDASRGSEYVETLRVYLSAFGDVSAAAARLQLHVTSLRYRLKRITSISKLDLSEPAERLLCELLLSSE